ncbi:DNA replication factor Cdt1 [Eucyclogobius newberryi]|uniref:DNA replication factor Cdt1 n=1 Tax=Eucyclogobius newberryi TaxID=166745 RepID=UPI003B5A7280
MSQARVTDFFGHRKKCDGPKKATKPRSRATTRSTAHKEPLSSSIHEEFVRVIDEAAGLKDPCVEGLAASPRTPKRTSGDAEFDLGTAVFSATTDHSTAKKSRATSAKAPEKRTARKQLILPHNSPQLQAPQLQQNEQVAAIRSPSPPPNSQDSSKHEAVARTSSSKQSCKAPRGGRGKALSGEELATLKSRLQGIKKRVETLSSSTPAPVPEPRTLPPVNTLPPTTAEILPATTLTSHDKELKNTLSRAKALAVKAQKRKEESKTSDPAEPQSVELPAYQKYHTLAQAVPPGLSLPYQYKVLAEMFRCMDTVVAMLFNRSETPTFMKIKKGVQDMMHKRFEESHVGQIRTVFPEAYTLRQEKNIPTFNNGIKKGSYQLTVEPVILCDGELKPTLTATRLLERRHIFHHNLVSLVKQQHKAFLSSLDPPLSVPEDKLSRWHPRFNVDTVPPVLGSPLPQSPKTESLTTAQEVLDKARALMTSKMESALVSVVLKSAEKAAVDDKETAATSCPTPTPTALKGVSQSLLERIRAKDAQKLQAIMTRNPAQDKRVLMMSRLGELARILRNVFVAEKKPALIMEVACNRMVASYTSALSTGEMEKHIRLLAEVASDWLTIVPIRKDFYLKLNKNMELSVIQDKLHTRLKEEERL